MKATLSKIQRLEIMIRACKLAESKSEADRKFLLEYGRLISLSELGEYRLLENYLDELEVGE